MTTKLTASKPAPRQAGRSKAKAKSMILRLYVAGHTPKSVAAVANLRKIGDEHLVGGYKLNVINLLKDPKLARGDQILAIPTLVRKLPLPVRRILGDLSNAELVLIALDLVPQKWMDSMSKRKHSIAMASPAGVRDPLGAGGN